MHRQQSSVKEHSSDALLVAILERDIIKVRELVHGGLGRCHTYSLFYPSYRKEFYFRTALMTAAATREYDLFSTVKRAFEGCCEGSDVSLTEFPTTLSVSLHLVRLVPFVTTALCPR